MKLEINIPPWAEERGVIYIVAKNELLAVYCEKTLWVKTKRCNYCGRCCVVKKDWKFGTKPGSTVGWDDISTVCKHLRREVWNFEPFNGKIVFVCDLGPNVPYGCVIGPCPACGREEFKRNLPECCLEFKVVKLGR